MLIFFSSELYKSLNFTGGSHTGTSAQNYCVKGSTGIGKLSGSLQRPLLYQAIQHPGMKGIPGAGSVYRGNRKSRTLEILFGGGYKTALTAVSLLQGFGHF